MRRPFWLLLGALLCWTSLARAEIAVPPLQARVTDVSGTLTATEVAALEQKLAAFEQRKGSQIAVLLLPTTGEETIEQYGIRVAESWKLGRKGIDDGALLLIAKDDRKLRIEVGYGLEGALPDAIAKRIIAETITPYFKRGDFYTGVSAGVDAMIAVVDGEPLPEPSRDRSQAEGSGGEAIGFLALIIGVVIGFIVRAATNRVAGGISALIVAAVIGAILVGVAVALFYALFAFAVVMGGGGGRRGGFIGGMGGIGGGGFGGGGFSGGGGGGGFGGGGASGGW